MRLGFAVLGSALVSLSACGGSTNDGLGGAAGTDGGATGGSSGSSGSGGATGGVGGGGTGGVSGSSGGGTGGVSGSSGGGTGGVGGGGTGGVSGSGGGTGGVGGSAGNAAVCSTVCQKLDQAQCPNDEPYSACFAGCQIDLASYQAQCGPQVSAWMSCVATSGTAVCTPSGDSRVTGCDSQLVSFIQCGGCIPSTGDDPCEACSKGSCCAELKAVYSHPQFASYLSCVYACSSEQCASQCYVQHSGLQTPITQLSQCQGASCQSC